MNRLTRRLLCWILSLTLAGLPLYASATSFEPSTGIPCHKMMNGDHAPDTDTDTTGLTVASKARTSCCDHCKDGCACQPSKACHGTSSSAAAILRNAVDPLGSASPPRYTRLLAALHSRDITPETSPPIA